MLSSWLKASDSPTDCPLACTVPSWLAIASGASAAVGRKLSKVVSLADEF
jgi:hypothetical protein